MAFVRLALLVLACLATASHAGPPDWLLEADISPAQTAVQTQATYRLRFFQGVDIRDLEITGPSVALGDVRPIDKGRVYEMHHQGRRYRVHERRYAVFPFTAGALRITGAHVVGTLAPSPASRQRRALRVDAAEQILQVSPVPAGHQLAARSLTLSETWTVPADHAIQANQTLRRQVRIEATGVDAAQIPAWSFAVPGMSVHAEPAQLENRLRNGLNVASRTQTFTLAPLRAGTIDIPEASLRWWDLAASRSSSTTLPPRKLHVTGATPPPPADSAAPPREAPLKAMLLAGVLALIAGTVWLLRARLGRWWRLQRALHAGDPRAVRDGLLAWAQASWPESIPPTLGRLAETLDTPGARQAAETLDRLIYGPAIPPLPPTPLRRLARQIKQGLRVHQRRNPRNFSAS